MLSLQVTPCQGGQCSCRVQICSGELRELGKATVSQKFYLEREIWSDMEYSLRDHSSVQEDLGWGTVNLLHRLWTMCAMPWLSRSCPESTWHPISLLVFMRVLLNTSIVQGSGKWMERYPEITGKKGPSASHTFYYSSGYQDWIRQQNHLHMSRTGLPARFNN